VQKYSTGLWVAGLVPTITNLAVIGISKGKMDLCSTPPGTIVMLIFGLGLVGAGIGFTIVAAKAGEANLCNCIDAITDPIELCFKFLGNFKNPYAITALILIDIVCGSVVGLARYSYRDPSSLTHH